MVGSLSTAAGRTSIRFGATGSATAAARGCERKAVTAGGTPAGTAPPGVRRPMIFGNAYPSAVDTALWPRPSRLAMPPRAVAPSARSIWLAATGAASGWPTQEATSEVRPPDLSLSRKPLRPPCEVEIIVRTYLTSVGALTPSPKRPARSSISVSNVAMSFSPKACSQVELCRKQ
jgi:hypothetical protein